MIFIIWQSKEKNKGDNMKQNGIITNSETTTYYKNGKIHREDGPAIEWINGNKHWLLSDRLHRTDGPAIDLVETELGTVKSGLSMANIIVKMVLLLNLAMAIKNGGLMASKSQKKNSIRFKKANRHKKAPEGAFFILHLPTI